MVHRVDLHTELRRLALDSEGTGPPARLHLSHRIVSCDVDACAITLEDGSVQAADVIIGADGIRVTAQTICILHLCLLSTTISRIFSQPFAHSF